MWTVERGVKAWSRSSSYIYIYILTEEQPRGTTQRNNPAVEPLSDLTAQSKPWKRLAQQPIAMPPLKSWFAFRGNRTILCWQPMDGCRSSSFEKLVCYLWSRCLISLAFTSPTQTKTNIISCILIHKSFTWDIRLGLVYMLVLFEAPCFPPRSPPYLPEKIGRIGRLLLILFMVYLLLLQLPRTRLYSCCHGHMQSIIGKHFCWFVCGLHLPGNYVVVSWTGLRMGELVPQQYATPPPLSNKSYKMSIRSCALSFDGILLGSACPSGLMSFSLR